MEASAAQHVIADTAAKAACSVQWLLEWIQRLPGPKGRVRGEIGAAREREERVGVRAMNKIGSKTAVTLAACLAGLLALAQPGRLVAQATASIHGHVQNAIGMPVQSGEIRLTTDKNPSLPSAKFQYAFPLDASGNYKGDGIKPGTYTGALFVQGHTVDFMTATPLAAGEDKTFDYDMTRKEYIDKMDPAERENMEKIKKDNAAAMAANAKIENLNALLKTARDSNKAGNYDAAVKAMTDATAAKPDESVLWDVLGDAQFGQANAAAQAAHDNKTTDPTLADKYSVAIASYQKALSLNAASAKPSAETAGVVNNQLGQALGKLALLGQPDKLKDSVAAYDAAAKADPTKAATYYFNEAATLFNAGNSTGKMDGVAEAADKVIAADPTRVEAYYVKAEGLAPSITGPDAAGKFVAPPGLVEACNKYLELAPTGPHAQDMKDLLAGLGEKVQTTYKAPKK
jgi:hypothetical protein